LQADYCNYPRLLLIFIEIKPGNAIRTRSRAKAYLFERPKIALAEILSEPFFGRLVFL